jgi:hypothetical protein
MRETVLKCDVCKKPTDKIVGKLHFIPSIPGTSRKSHSNYTHTADIGVCCKDKLLQGINFRKRMTFDEYQRRRRGERVA